MLFCFLYQTRRIVLSREFSNHFFISDIKTIIGRDFLDTKIDSIDSNELNRTSEEEEEEEEEGRIALVHSSES
jgi:hypothetical protein